MIRIDAEGLARWRAEVELGLEFRDKKFGTYRQQAPGAAPTTTLAGRNLDLFEQGARTDDYEPPLNLVFPLVKTIVPTQFFQNPRAIAVPDQIGDAESAEDAFYVSELLNRDLRDVDFRFKETGQQSVFDSFVLGFGVVKIGYATEFGQDILPTKQETRKKFRERVKEQLQRAVTQIVEAVGLKAPAEPEPLEPEPPQNDFSIQSESAYVQWIDPFDFVVDPRARDLPDARWVAQRIRRTLAEVKEDRRYSQEKQTLVADALDDDRIQESFIEAFQTVDLWEVHYRSPESPTGIRLLTFAMSQTQTKALIHEDNGYDLGGWQYEWLTPNKHGHQLYPISTLSVVRPLLDRINASFEALLEQLDKFVAKVAFNERLTKEGESALQTGVIGGRVKVSGNDDVRGALAVISMDQLNAEVIKFLDYCVDFVILAVGLTRAQLTGLTTAQTATEAQIGQSGQNLRRTDEGSLVATWTNRVVAKLWRVKAQFQSFQDIALPQESALNPQTGMPTTRWYPAIDAKREARLKANRFKLHIEVGSIQKPNLEIIRAQFSEFARNMMEPVVTQGLALEGKRLSASEIIRQYSRFFAEYGLQSLERIVVPIQDEAMRQSLLNYGQKPAAVNGQPLTGAVPNRADLISAAAGERGQGVLPA